MLKRTIQTEFIKLQHSPVWLAFFLLPILPAIMGTFNYVQNIGILQDEWYSLWTQHTLFTCYFFLPAIIGVYCSYLCRLEHTNHNWNLMMSAPIPVSYIFLAKLFIVSFMVVLTQVWIGALFVLSGKIIGLTSPVPLELTEWLLTGTLGAIVICALQLSISLVIRSFAVPVGIALIGGIVNIAALAKGYGIWFPYSLMSLGMRANGPKNMMVYSMEQYIVNSLLFIAAFCLFSTLWLKKRDVVTG